MISFDLQLCRVYYLFLYSRLEPHLTAAADIIMILYMIRPYSFNGSYSRIRKVKWKNLPLGSVIIQWPVINGAAVNELAAYPLITERLRTELRNKYQFLDNITVTIADPSAGLDQGFINSIVSDARQLLSGIPAMQALKKKLRQNLYSRSDIRDGIAGQLKYEDSPFFLKKNWARSVRTCLHDTGDFGSGFFGEDITKGDLTGLISRMIMKEVPLPSQRPLSVDVGIDVSRSMYLNGKSESAFQQFLDIILKVSREFPYTQWRLWLVSGGTEIVHWDRFAGTELRGIDGVMARHDIESGETRFSPFFRKVLNERKSAGKQLCILITDGACSDMAAALRSAEELKGEGIDYLQLILHRDEEYRNMVRLGDSAKAVDGVVSDEEISDDDSEHKRTDEDLKSCTDDLLKRITDIAEAAHGGQIVMTYYPVFSFVSLDVYERYLGEILSP